jgi:hypothetical protein
MFRIIHIFILIRLLHIYVACGFWEILLDLDVYDGVNQITMRLL